MADINTLLKEADHLPIVDKWRLVTHVLRSLEGEQTAAPSSNWHAALRATYGILADDPIERPSQLPIEQREPIE
jgi:hypothetical protein